MTAQAEVNALVAEALPQGGWGDDDYLWLTDHGRRLVEFTDGYLEVLPMPSREHQRIVAFLYTTLHGYLRRTGGEVLFAPLRLRIREGKFREPDLVLLRDSEDARSGERFWTGADLVIEVVSPDDPGRDFVQKRGDYAEAAIPEYWIVEPGTRRRSPCSPSSAEPSSKRGVFEPRGICVVQAILDGFGVAVDDVLPRGRVRIIATGVTLRRSKSAGNPEDRRKLAISALIAEISMFEFRAQRRYRPPAACPGRRGPRVGEWFLDIGHGSPYPAMVPPPITGRPAGRQPGGSSLKRTALLAALMVCAAPLLLTAGGTDESSIRQATPPPPRRARVPTG